MRRKAKCTFLPFVTKGKMQKCLSLQKAYYETKGEMHIFAFVTKDKMQKCLSLQKAYL